MPHTVEERTPAAPVALYSLSTELAQEVRRRHEPPITATPPSPPPLTRASLARGHYAVHGVLDMPRQPDGHGFSRFEYPSRLPEEVQERMIDLSERYLRHVGFDDGCFNAEFMWDRDHDRLWLVRRVPTDEDLERLRERFPETRLRVQVETGQRLGDLENQDSYHFNIAEVFLGADSPESLEEGQQACRELLTFEFEPVP